MQNKPTIQERLERVANESETNLNRLMGNKIANKLQDLETSLTNSLNIKLSNIEREIQKSITIPLWKIVLLLTIIYSLVIAVILWIWNPTLLPSEWKKEIVNQKTMIMIPYESVKETTQNNAIGAYQIIIKD